MVKIKIDKKQELVQVEVERRRRKEEVEDFFISTVFTILEGPERDSSTNV